MNRIVKNSLVIMLGCLIFGLLGYIIGYMLEDELKDWVGIIYGIFGLLLGFIISVIFLITRSIKKRV